jgi:hypothetical protein
MDDLSRLPHNTTMDDGLVIRFDQGCVMQNDHFSLEVKHRCWLGILVYKDHTLTELVSFELLLLHESLYTETNGLASNRTVHFNSLIMDSSNLYRLELARLIWTQLQRLAWQHSTSKHCACHNDSNTSDHVNPVNVELDLIVFGTELARCVDSRVDATQKFTEFRNTFARHI